MGKPMTKMEFLSEFCGLFPNVDEAQSAEVADALLARIVDTLAEGGRIEIRGFGSFGVKFREARRGRNPQNGNRVDVAPRCVAYFKAGKMLKEYVNNTEPVLDDYRAAE